MQLCAYSRSRVLSHHVLPECPLNLKESQHDGCICRKRIFVPHGADSLRVLSCEHPNDWRGNRVDDAQARDRAIRETNKGREKVAEIDMSDEQAKPDSTEPTNPKPAPSGKPTESPSLWGSIKIPMIGVTGEKGAGKTLFGLSIDPPRTVVVDLEDSSISYNIDVGLRVSLYDEMLKKYKRVATPVECFMWFMEFVNSLPDGKFTTLFVDPITDIETGQVEWVKANPKLFGRTAGQYERASGLLWADVKSHWKMFLGTSARKFETFCFSAHMGNVWKGSQPTGKRAPKGKETLFELASLYLQLERKPDDKGRVPDKPSGIVLKSRLAVSRFVDGDMVHTPILPPRLPVATPASIRKYIANPPDYSKLKKDELAPAEVLSEDERLEIQRETAALQLEVEQTRLARAAAAVESQERLQEARLRQQERVTSIGGDGASTSNGNGNGNGHVDNEVASGGAIESDSVATIEDDESSSRANIASTPEPSVYQVIETQRRELKITDAQWLDILGKRGVKKSADLPPPAAEEIRLKLWDRLTKAGMNAALAGPAQKN